MRLSSKASGRPGSVRAAAARLPRAPGVYRFRDGRGRLLYVGRAGDLRGRVPSYWSAGGGGDRPWLAPMVARIARIEAVVCDSRHEAAWLERNLLEHAPTPWNRALGGQEVPVFIRLDARAGSPGITVVHDPLRASVAGVRHFGPYLGGNKVRRAVSALRRTFPVDYAAGCRTGFGEDMGRALGVDPADRALLFQRLGALLDRDPVAVGALRAELAHGRDTAAQDLAFERAGRLHAELAAIDWIVAEQKVALLEPSDADIHGWAEGVLVRFEMRAGRLIGWRRRPCSESRARPKVAATPPEWSAFARRNAELAARLVSG